MRSLTIGLVGITVSFVLGLFFGGLAGYMGGWVDYAVMRLIEILLTDPDLKFFMFTGCYRDNEVFAGHPFFLMLEN